jgi:hypothetical protein
MLARRPLAAPVLALALLLTLSLLPRTGASAGPRAHARRATVQPSARRAAVQPSVRADRMSPAGRELLARGYLVPHPAAYDRAKLAAAGMGGAPSRSRPHVRASAAVPTLVRSWKGVFDQRTTPSDSTGAIGPKRYVEMVNTKFGIYDRTGAALSTGDLGVLTGLGRNSQFLTDPQVIWDPGTRRFYYVVLDFDVAVRVNSNGIDFAFGFSKGASPSSPADWCPYTLSLGYDDPDRGSFRLVDQPHLGDTQDLLAWGGNVFDTSEFPRFVGADVDWVKKPAAGPGCPKADTLVTGEQHKLRMPNGRLAFTPVVANQTDDAHIGWAVASRFLPNESTTGTSLTLFRIGRPGSDQVVSPTGDAVPVDGYQLPPAAPQKGGHGRLIDTLDGRLTQAVSAVDPSHGRVAIWTSHAVGGGAGARVQWYEIDPSHLEVFQQGEVSDPDLFVFNSAISPDRKVFGDVRAFGSSMVLGFDTSSHDTDVRVQMVSKVGHAEQSALVPVKSSPGAEIDGSCQPVCRWGDYPGASPDPAANPNATHGRVWLTNMWNVANVPNRVDWRTVNWEAAP